MGLENQEHNTLKLKKLGVDFRNEHLLCREIVTYANQKVLKL